MKVRNFIWRQTVKISTEAVLIYVKYCPEFIYSYEYDVGAKFVVLVLYNNIKRWKKFPGQCPCVFTALALYMFTGQCPFLFLFYPSILFQILA